MGTKAADSFELGDEPPDPQLKLPGMPPGLYHYWIADGVRRGELACACRKLKTPCSCPCDCGNMACDDVTGKCCWCMWAYEMEFM